MVGDGGGGDVGCGGGVDVAERDTVILSSEAWVGNTFKMETPKTVSYTIRDIGWYPLKNNCPFYFKSSEYQHLILPVNNQFLHTITCLLFLSIYTCDI